MQLTRSEESGITVLEVHGTIKLGESAQQFADALGEIFSGASGGVLLDLAEIDYVDSTGIGELVGHLQKYGRANRKMVLFRPHKRIESLLKLTRLDSVFPIFWERDEAFKFLTS